MGQRQRFGGTTGWAQNLEGAAISAGATTTVGSKVSRGSPHLEAALHHVIAVEVADEAHHPRLESVNHQLDLPRQQAGVGWREEVI